MVVDKTTLSLWKKPISFLSLIDERGARIDSPRVYLGEKEFAYYVGIETHL